MVLLMPPFRTPPRAGALGKPRRTAIGVMVCLSLLAAASQAPADPPAEVAGPTRPATTAADEKPTAVQKEDRVKPVHPSSPAPSADAPSTQRSVPQPEAAVVDVGPDIYYLPDEQGKLRPVPGWTLEDFRRLIDQQTAEGQAPPFNLQRLTAQGQVEGTHVRLNVEITIKTAEQRRDRWVRVPLQLNGAILAEPAKTNRGTLMLEYQQGGEGYIAWIKGAGDEPAVLTLPMLLPVKSAGGQQQITWSLPRVAPSQLKLLVPLANAQAEVSSGGTLLPPAAASGGSELTVLGLGGDLRLGWQGADQRDSSRGGLMEVEGNHLVRVERGLIRTQAQFSIRSLGGTIDRIRIRLPRGARLVPDGAARGYTVRVVEAERKTPADRDRPLVEVQLDKEGRGPVSIPLACEQSFDVSGLKKPLELATFDVEGAARHWGSIAVQVVGDWHLFWEDTDHVRRVDSALATLPAGDLTASFEYSGQPYRLAARIAPPVTRVSVEPQYVLMVSADGTAGATHLKLDARLKYRVSGAKVFQLPIDLAGWELQEGEVGPASRVDVARLPPAAAGPRIIPLVAPQKGEFEITFSAQRRLPVGTLTTSFPRPLADNVAAATVVVVPDDNVQLTPQRDAMAGLAPLPVTPPLSLPQRVQSPLYYRAEKPDARLAAKVQIQGRSVAAESSSVLRVLERAIQVRQTIRFEVSYEAVEWLSLLVPRELTEPGALEIALAGASIHPLLVRRNAPDEASAGHVELRVPLTKPRIGTIDLVLHYQIPIGRPQSADAGEHILPLVAPADVKVQRSELMLEPSTAAAAQVADAAWSPSEDIAGGSAGRRYRANGAPLQVALLVRSQGPSTSGNVVVQRGWVQSWFSGKFRHDQAAYLLRNREDRLQIELPDGAEQAASEVWLDGKPVVAEFNSASSLTVPLPVDNGPHRLMLRYRVPVQGSGWFRRAQLPRFPSGTWVQRMYWQLVLPPDAHLLALPLGTTPEYLWQRQGWIWQRQSSLDELALAQWIGLPTDEARVPATAQRYLLSLSDASGDYRLSVIPRGALVLISAGSILCAGLLFVYVPRLRHPGIVLAVVTLPLVLALFFPEPALLASQPAVLGLALVFLVAALRRWLSPTSPAVRGTGGGRPSHPSHSATDFVQSGSASAVSTGSTRDLPVPVAAGNASGSTKAAVS